MITAQEYYQEHEDIFNNVINTRHILVKTKEEAEALLERIKQGEDFGALAEKYSICPSGKDNKGELGFWPNGIAVPPYENAAHALKQVGDISEPVKSEFGYHLIELLGKKEHLTFEECKDIVQQIVDLENEGK